MDLNEILKEVAIRYPKGTKYISAVTPNKTTANTIMGTNYEKWINSSWKASQCAVTEKNSSGLLHADGIWARVISYPEGYKLPEEVVPQIINAYEIY